MTAPEPALTLTGIEKAFGEAPVLRGCDLALPVGSTTALVGPSAGGKTVLMKCAAGLLPIDAGRIDALGEHDVEDWDAIRPRIGVLFQQNALFDSMRVWENIAFPLRRAGTSRADARARAFSLLAQVGLKESAGEGFPISLSGGMRKRAALARAVAASPDLLLLDDPTAGLDPVLATSMERLIRNLVQREHATALVITADVENLGERFDYAALLDQGRILWHGPASEAAPDLHPLLAAA